MAPIGGGSVGGAQPTAHSHWPRRRPASPVSPSRSTRPGARGRPNAATAYAELARRGAVPDIVTDMTVAHDLRYGYVPSGMDIAT